MVKQSLYQFRENPLISGLSVAGTALAIAVVLVLVLVFLCFFSSMLITLTN